jgi:hypothetical protein
LLLPGNSLSLVAENALGGLIPSSLCGVLSRLNYSSSETVCDLSGDVPMCLQGPAPTSCALNISEGCGATLHNKSCVTVPSPSPISPSPSGNSTTTTPQQRLPGRWCVWSDDWTLTRFLGGVGQDWGGRWARGGSFT